MNRHKHVNWDDPGPHSVLAFFKDHPDDYREPAPGSVLSARYAGHVVRIKVEAYIDDTSIGDIAAIITPSTGERVSSINDLKLGDIVRLPDDKRAMETPPSEKADNAPLDD
ncbi:hypothetical protein [Halomonas halocynthiae]|uniref:hypothetical protein n=1 Tax=Halomonas halocynthiae TaxID=176290 RepID=UPI000405FBEC|nr:hypothetical protein [Halomonas halocynthiae]